MSLKIRSVAKKGDVPDTIIFVIMLFVLVVGFFIIAFTVPFITDGLRIAGLNNTVEGSAAINQLETFGLSTIQKGVFFLMVGLLISTLITSFLTRTHPIFIFLYILSLGLAIFLSVYLANAYDLIRDNVAFATFTATQTLLHLIMENLVVIVLGVGALSMIIIFAKFSSAGRSIQGQL